MKKQFHKMQAWTETINGGEVFTSYNSPIARLEPNCLYVTGRYDYSVTTSRQFSRWLIEREICKNFDEVHTLKKLLKDMQVYADDTHAPINAQPYLTAETRESLNAFNYKLVETPWTNSDGRVFVIVYMDYMVAISSYGLFS